MKPEPKSSGGPPNPYLAARREWNERYGDYIAAERSWKAVAIGSLFIAAIAVGGVIWIGSQAKLVPFVIEVDKLGQAVPVRQASVASPVEPRVIAAQLANWIVNMRTVYADATADQNLIKQAYAMIGNGSQAFQVANDLFSKTPPWVAAQTETTSVSVESVLPLSGNTWQVDWNETIVSRDGASTSTQEWQANISIVVRPPTEAAQIMANPMGIYVVSFNWTRRL